MKYVSGVPNTKHFVLNVTNLLLLRKDKCICVYEHLHCQDRMQSHLKSNKNNLESTF